MNIAIEIKGTTPLLCNKFTDEAQMNATNGTRSSMIGHRGTPKEIAEAKLYTDENGKLIIPSPNMLRSIIDAGKFVKAGRSKVTTQKSSLIPACVGIDEFAIKIIHKEPWTIDTRPVRIPATGGRILAHRPCFNDWILNFHMELDDTVISSPMFREIIDLAGKRIGLGDFRPDCKGPFGKYVVTSWKETK